MAEEDLSVTLNLRITPADDARIDALKSRSITKSIVARAALRIGLQAIEGNKALILTAGDPEPPRKPAR